MVIVCVCLVLFSAGVLFLSFYERKYLLSVLLEKEQILPPKVIKIPTENDRKEIIKQLLADDLPEEVEETKEDTLTDETEY